ncbi:heterokaryon incompatibility protein-domain-containing protein [Boeremia exigua]|uniref:heterokaryon incompatibility protein-domain-containing protein n=1 Tax=Boeremia exigua TaxID=749465 RepID=UPI001E8E526F|nr:heterokaryon incompatibility protein-domain-containing protein [Boeremia exigua]KAH6622066.1 heterokaryon incompatibility protein-domain-containing protein [Boeremia exigua]
MEVTRRPRECSSASSTDDEYKFVRPGQCICCRRSKTQGTFFELKKGYLSHRFWARWEATGNLFRAAAEQNCSRCGFVFDIVVAYMSAMSYKGTHFIRVWNGIDDPHSLRAMVMITITSAGFSGSRSLRLLHLKDGFHDLAKLPWNVVTYPTLAEDPVCEQALAPAKAWMEECLKSHEECQSTAVSQMPTRVLELSGSKVSLRDTQEIGSTSMYACLSHCWGDKGPSIQLTSSSAAQLKAGVHNETLPKTFSEAVKVCLQLGISYLWIDALCIYQDDLSDWEECASEMAGVYSNALITIAARSAGTSDDGLRHFVKDRFRNILVPSTGLYVREYERELGLKSFHQEDKDLFPLMTRAWVFQERHLSPRTLGFDIYQLVWQCQRSCRIEEGPVLAHKGYLQTEPEDLTSTWHEIVEAYSKLQITHESDRLPALSALAKKMGDFRGDDTYLAGLWTKTLLRDLQWQAFSPYQQRCNANAPSWSWASVTGQATYPPCSLLPSVELLNVSYTPDGPSHMGRSTESRLTIKGQIGSVIRRQSEFRGYNLVLSNQSNSKFSGSGIQLQTDPDLLPGVETATQTQETLTVLFMTSEIDSPELFKRFSGLLLRRASASAYERIAWIDVSYKGEFDSWDITDAFSDDSDPSTAKFKDTAEFFACSDTPMDKYMATLPVEAVTII